MKKTGGFLLVLLILAVSGCQQAQQDKTAGVSRRDKLMASENLNLQGELAKCRGEIEKQQKLLEKCRSESEKQRKLAEDQKKLSERYYGESEKQRVLFEQCRWEKAQIIQVNDNVTKLKNELAKCQKEIEKQKQLIEQYLKEIDSKDDPAICRDRIDKQKKLVKQCQQDKEKDQAEAGDTAKFLMDKMPANLKEEVESLTNENAQLKARIEDLEKARKDANEIQKPQ